jgi:hypothetical protein
VGHNATLRRHPHPPGPAQQPTLLDHIVVFGVTMTLSAAVTFAVGAALLGRL